ncbi:hypothetical protein ACFQHN_15235 [Natrialbaceae archaeon GCM10025896]
MNEQTTYDDETGGTHTEDDHAYCCPWCDSTIRRENGTLRCQSCEYAPSHGAD